MPSAGTRSPHRGWLFWSTVGRAEGRWSGRGAAEQLVVSGADGCQGCPQGAQQRSCPLLQLRGALVLLQRLVPTLPGEVSSSLGRGEGGSWLAATAGPACPQHHWAAQAFSRAPCQGRCSCADYWLGTDRP